MALKQQVAKKKHILEKKIIKNADLMSEFGVLASRLLQACSPAVLVHVTVDVILDVTLSEGLTNLPDASGRLGISVPVLSAVRLCPRLCGRICGEAGS